MIETNELTKRFPPNQNFALAPLTLSIPKGELVALVGPDGAGKTTLLRLLAGLLTPTSGTATIEGKAPSERRDEIGYMPQQFGLYEDLTVEENMELYAALQGLKGEAKEEQFKRLFKLSGLAPFTKRLAGNLSGGMKQKLGLISCLMRKPKVLLLDEPSVGVDPLSRRELFSIVEELLEEEITIIWSTAYLDEAEKCRSMLLLSEGKLLYLGKPKTASECIELFGRPSDEESPLASAFVPLHLTRKEMIIAEGLTKKFGNFTAVSDVSFKVERGEIFGLLGPNGAGKSTTFKMLCGLATPTSGSTHVNGYNLLMAPSKARSQIGYMAQKFALYGNMSVEQNLAFFAGIYPVKNPAEMIEKMLTIFELTPHRTMPAGKLPLGFQRRLSLAAAVMHEPPVLFLDEPTSGVDPITRIEFWKHMNGLVKKGMTLMVTTHFMDEAEYCNRIGLISHGKLMMIGTPTELKSSVKSASLPHPTLEDAFIQLSEGGA